eukprot:TRINITY_DN9836_c0_g1_i1.p1 TRINITY_DN9836_c0_g1~~TRINITY_DN9836_c0_g1_i1.p1  ORF type:complete len:133 (-),score=2.63 TRINITY_DN9836_c0_g1_i1:133-531(-)
MQSLSKYRCLCPESSRGWQGSLKHAQGVKPGLAHLWLCKVKQTLTFECDRLSILVMQPSRGLICHPSVQRVVFPVRDALHVEQDGCVGQYLLHLFSCSYNLTLRIIIDWRCRRSLKLLDGPKAPDVGVGFQV